MPKNDSHDPIYTELIVHHCGQDFHDLYDLKVSRVKKNRGQMTSDLNFNQLLGVEKVERKYNKNVQVPKGSQSAILVT